MANKKINIAELSIDDKALLKSTQDIAKQLKALKDDNKELKKSGLETSKVYIQNSVDIKLLSKAYGSNIKAMTERIQSTVDAETRSEQLSVALNVEANSVDSLREQNKLLNKLRNSANILTAEGRAELELLNKQLDENNELIKENVDAYTQQKINIGNYKDSIKEAFQELNIFNGGLGGFISRSQEAGGVGSLVTNSLKGITQGMLGATKATLAFIATPLGALLAVLVGAFALVKNALDRSEGSMNKLKKAFAPAVGLFKSLLKTLEPLGDFLIDGIVVAFELAEKSILGALDAIATGLELLGFEDSAKGLRNFKQGIVDTANSSRELADAEAQLAENTRKTQLIQLEYLKDAEKLRQIRDDENASIKDRMKANEDLGGVLKKQIAEELDLARQALELTDLRIEQEGRTTDLLDERAERLIAIAEIQERITGQESEQLTNRVSLQKEAIDKQKEYADQLKAQAEERIKTSEEELDLFIAQQGFREKTLEQQLKIDQAIAEKRLKIFKDQLDAKLISEEKYNTLALQVRNDLLKQQSELAVQNAELEIQAYVDANSERLNADKFLTEQLLKEEINRQQRLSDKRKEFQALQLENGVINQTEYNIAVNGIDEEFRIAKEEIEAEREEVANEKKLLDLELRREAEQLTFEEDLELSVQRLNLQKEAELKTAEATGAERELINKKYALAEKQLRQSVEIAKVSLIEQGLGQAKGFFKENTVAYKAIAIAEATMNTYKAASLALSTYAYPIGGIFAGLAIGQGLLQVGKIAGVKFEKGGIGSTKGGFAKISGPSHSNGGVPVFAGDTYVGEAQGDEGIGILNRSAFSDFMNYNNSFLDGKSTTGTYAGGGIITQTVKPTSGTKEIVDGFSKAVENLPRPVATIEDIDRGYQNKILIEDGATS